MFSEDLEVITDQSEFHELIENAKGNSNRKPDINGFDIEDPENDDIKLENCSVYLTRIDNNSPITKYVVIGTLTEGERKKGTILAEGKDNFVRYDKSMANCALDAYPGEVMDAAQKAIAEPFTHGWKKAFYE